jgi:long-chain acyl-CoA synthetase
MTDHYRVVWDQLTAPGAPFELKEVTVRGVSLKTFAAVPPNMRVIWEMATANGDKPYLIYEDERYTYNEIAASVRSLAHALRDDHGVGRGDRVAIAMRNYPEWIISYWATISIGAAVVGMNAWWTGPEMAYGLSDSAPKVLIADAERVARVVPLLAEHRAASPMHVIAVRTTASLPGDATRWEDVVRPASAPAALPDAVIAPDDDLCIFYTSGTTGFPKGAQLTHRGCLDNVFNIMFMLMVASAGEAAAVAAGDLEPSSKRPTDLTRVVQMLTTPLFHVTANNCGMHPVTLAGGCLVLLRKWDARRALELIEREQITNLQGVPTMGRELIAHPDWATRDTSSLRGIAGGGAQVQPDLVAKLDRALASGGPSTGYGLTETSGIVTAIGTRAFTTKPASCGPVVPTLDAKLVDGEGGDIAPHPEAIGELWVKGSTVIKGYLNKPEATAAAIKDGWFATGDIARIDAEGYVYIVDRAKDMVNRAGENVFCNEVEVAIYEHPAVAEASVFGIPDERLGEDVAAAIVLHPGAELSAEELRAFLSGRISPFKIPSHVHFRHEPLPRNASGKFLKRALRDELLAL